MKTLVVGVGGMTNGGKSTLSKSLHQRIPNSCLIAQDTYFKDDSVVPVDDNGFKQYDMLDALHMDKMMSDVESWQRDPESFLKQQSLYLTPSDHSDVFVLIVEGFLIYNCRSLNQLFDQRYFLEIPYDVCKERRSSRVYTPPDPPGYFDGHVWPMYLKNREEMESTVSGVVFLDGLKPKEELFAEVFEDVCQEIERLRGRERCGHFCKDGEEWRDLHLSQPPGLMCYTCKAEKGDGHFGGQWKKVPVPVSQVKHSETCL